MAAEAALADGVAANVGGGTHHAFADGGRGLRLQRRRRDRQGAPARRPGEHRARRRPRRPPGRRDARGLHGRSRDVHVLGQRLRNYPFRRVPGDLEADLPDGTEDERYLDSVARLLPQALARSRPDICFYLAGADPFRGDRLGRLSLTKDGLAARDALVRDSLAAAGVPVCLTLAGGYADPIADTVEINLETLRTFASRS